MLFNYLVGLLVGRSFGFYGLSKLWVISCRRHFLLQLFFVGRGCHLCSSLYIISGDTFVGNCIFSLVVGIQSLLSVKSVILLRVCTSKCVCLNLWVKFSVIWILLEY